MSPAPSEHDYLVFIHIHKTAGSTFFNIVHRLYDQKTVVVPRGTDPRHAVATMPPDTRAFRGLMAWGIDELLDGRTTYVTVLREPIERVISGYHEVRRNPEHPLSERIQREDISLERFVADGMAPIVSWDGQVRILSGQPESKGEVTDDMVKAAEHNLRHRYAVVGLTERFHEFLVVARHVLGWSQAPYYKRLNVGADRPPKREVSPEVIDLIRDRNRRDIQIYQTATEVFDEQVRAMGWSFRPKLWAFDRGQRRYERR